MFCSYSELINPTCIQMGRVTQLLLWYGWDGIVATSSSRQHSKCVTKQWTAAKAIRSGTGTDTEIPGCSIRLSRCLLAVQESFPLVSHLGPPDHRGRTGQRDVVRATHLVYCPAPAVVMTHRGAHQALPDSSSHKICVPCYSFPHLLTLLFTALVPPFLHLSLLSTKPSLNAFFSLFPFCCICIQIRYFDTIA